MLQSTKIKSPALNKMYWNNQIVKIIFRQYFLNFLLIFKITHFNPKLYWISLWFQFIYKISVFIQCMDKFCFLLKPFFLEIPSFTLIQNQLIIIQILKFLKAMSVFRYSYFKKPHFLRLFKKRIYIILIITPVFKMHVIIH